MIYLYRPSSLPYRRGSPILTLEDLLEAAHTQWADQLPTYVSPWPHDDNLWFSTTSDTPVAVHQIIRLLVLPWVAELRAVITAENAEIGIESGPTALFDTAAPETRDVLLTVTAAEAGSTRSAHQLFCNRRGGSGTATIYGLSLYQVPVSTLPDGV